MAKQRMIFRWFTLAIVMIGLVFVPGCLFLSTSHESDQPSPSLNENISQNVASIRVSVLTNYSGDPHPKWIATPEELGLTLDDIIEAPRLAESRVKEREDLPVFQLDFQDSKGQVLVWMLVGATEISFSTGNGKWHYLEDTIGLNEVLEAQAAEQSHQVPVPSAAPNVTVS